ncbi:MAG: cation-translocating P-type ATPase [Tenericutes bacterium]|nr:cation-translocating P-type ATPase [Mycoplasmatota bacterium]
MKYEGLTKSEVKKRIDSGKVNYDTTTPSKSIKQILLENTVTLFNFINIVLGVAIVLVGSYKNLLFLGVVICNTLISSIQEIRAKKMVDKLSVISSSKASVIRNGKKEKIHINDIVVDDIILYELGNQVVVDSVILEGTCEADESFITGESKMIIKKKGDMLLSGSFIVSGNVTSKVVHVGLDNYTSIISRDAKKIKKDISSEIMRSLKKIVKYVSIALVPIGVLLLLRQFSIDDNTTQNAVTTVVAALIAMIPEGLILLVSTVLAISVLKLSKYNVLVQDLYAVETLARVDTLCLDKTGTLTEGKMEVKEIIPVNDNKISEIDEILNLVAASSSDNNSTINAIKEKFNMGTNIKYIDKIPFSSDRKYSGVILKDKSYIIGAPEFVLKNHYKKYKEIIEEGSLNNRVLALIETDVVKNYEIKGKIKVLGFIFIRDKIRKTAYDTIKYFKENDVDLKIISGDSKETVSSIASRLDINIKGTIDASLISKDMDVNKIVEENTIFGRVKPEQKKLFISALKRNGHVVAMTGDGVNDVLALKEADCGVAMNSGADAARNISEIVLLDSNFDSMPKIVMEGRRTINNVERSATLFLSKTIYASLLALLFLFINYAYPFIPIQMTLINSLTIGIPAFILALEPNKSRIKGKFLVNVISKAIPSGITTVVNILLLVLLASLLKLPTEQTSTCAVIITAYTALLLIYRISKPLNFLRTSLLVLLTSIFVLAFIIPAGREIFSLKILSVNSLLVLIPLMYLSTRLFKILSTMIGYVIDKKKKWFM